jgi:hypothetical protein
MSSVLISSYLERKSFHSTTAAAVDSKRNTADNTARIAVAASHWRRNLKESAAHCTYLAWLAQRVAIVSAGKVHCAEPPLVSIVLSTPHAPLCDNLRKIGSLVSWNKIW